MINREDLIKECKTIEDNARYTSKAHYLMASRNKSLAIWFEIIPAMIAAVSGVLVLSQTIPPILGWITVVSALISAISNILSPHKSHYENLNTAKNFTITKTKAKSLYDSFSTSLDDDQLYNEVKSLSDNYNNLIQHTPPTSEWAYKKAVKLLNSEH